MTPVTDAARVSIQRIIGAARELPFKPLGAIGTSVVRDAGNASDPADALESELGVSLHPLTTWEESSLLGQPPTTP